MLNYSWMHEFECTCLIVGLYIAFTFTVVIAYQNTCVIETYYIKLVYYKLPIILLSMQCYWKMKQLAIIKYLSKSLFLLILYTWITCKTAHSAGKLNCELTISDAKWCLLFYSTHRGSSVSECTGWRECSVPL